jgi:hypothetical protein
MFVTVQERAGEQHMADDAICSAKTLDPREHESHWRLGPELMMNFSCMISQYVWQNVYLERSLINQFLKRNCEYGDEIIITP